MPRRSTRRGVASAAAVQGISGSIAAGVIAQLILIASGIVVARSLGPENRGIFALVFVLSTIAVQVGSLGMPSAFTYWLATRRSTLSALLCSTRKFRFVQMLGVLGAHATLIYAVLIPRTESAFVWAAMLTLVASAASLYQMYGLALLQGRGDFRAFNLLRILNGTLYLAGVLALWAIDRATLTSLTVIVVVSVVGGALATWSGIVRRADGGGELSGESSQRSMVVFGLRSLLGSSSPSETFRLDQLIVGVVLPPVALGYYVVALAFTNLGRFIAQSIGMVTFPRVAASSAWDAQLKIVRRHVALTGVLTGLITVAIIATIPWLLPFFFGSGFESAVGAAQVLLVGAYAAGLRRVLVDATRGAGWPLWGAIGESVTLLALPAVAIAAQFNDSVTIAAVVVAAANVLGLLVLAPALVQWPYRRALGSVLPAGATERAGGQKWPVLTHTGDSRERTAASHGGIR